jgi:MoaA/NifB/PqqE/SkfB family radical SAM enzyme
MSKEVDLKKYVCTWPFMYTEVYDNDRQYLCCPNLMGVNVHETGDFEKDWFGDKAKMVRESILDGSYKYCDRKQCSHLHRVLEKDEPSFNIITREDFESREWNKPKWINFCFDFSCNLKCPSCRPSLINADPTKILEIDDKVLKIEEAYSDEVEELHITSTGDPFYSKSYRDYLINFKPEKYPNLKKIHLHTNGTLWNKDMWERMPNVHQYVKSAHISIDAATKETYEKVRLNGKWDVLLSNLEYLSKEVIPNFEFIICSMVVQKDNYKEMVDFVKMIKGYFGDKARIQLFKIIKFPFHTKEYWDEQCIYEPTHPEYNLFLDEIEKIKGIEHVNENLS